MDGSLAELQRLGYEGGNVRQLKLITLHSALSREAKDIDIFLKGHYKCLLLSLKRLMESYGPVLIMNDGLIQFQPVDLAKLPRSELMLNYSVTAITGRIPSIRSSAWSTDSYPPEVVNAPLGTATGVQTAPASSAGWRAKAVVVAVSMVVRK
jgi:hypothetical protein